MDRPKGALGLTLLEILIALLIGGILLMLGVPGYRAWIADLEMRDRIEALVVTMSRARAEAIKRQARVALCPSSDGRRCPASGRWEDGWIVFADHNDDGDRDADETIVAVEPPSWPGNHHSRQQARVAVRFVHELRADPHDQRRVADGDAHRVPAGLESGRRRAGQRRSRARGPHQGKVLRGGAKLRQPANCAKM